MFVSLFKRFVNLILKDHLITNLTSQQPQQALQRKGHLSVRQYSCMNGLYICNVILPIYPLHVHVYTIVQLYQSKLIFQSIKISIKMCIFFFFFAFCYSNLTKFSISLQRYLISRKTPNLVFFFLQESYGQVYKLYLKII